MTSNYSPIPNSYLLVDKLMRMFLFCDLKKVNSKFRKKLKFVYILNIKQMENFLKKIKDKSFSIDSLTCSVFYKSIIKNNNRILKQTDPIYLLKSKKIMLKLKMQRKFMI